MAFAISADQLDQVARDAAGHLPFELAGAFFQQAQRETDPTGVEAWTLMGMAFTGQFQPSNHRDPYGTPASTAITRSNAPNLKPIVADITVPTVRARLADLIWLRERDVAMARLATTSYLESARLAEDPQKWVACAHYAERSARLATQLSDANHDVFAYLEDVAQRYQDGQSRFLTVEAVRILTELRAGDASARVPMLRRVAGAMMDARLSFAARSALDLMMTIGHRAQALDIVREAHLEIARSFELEAAEKVQAGQNGVAASFYHSAIETYQHAGGARDHIDRLRPVLEAAERKALTELKRFSAPFDATQMIARATKAVSGLPLPNALLAFASVHPICDYAQLRQQVLDTSTQMPLFSMTAGTILGPRGQTVARRPGMTLNKDAENEQAVIAQMLDRLVLSRRAIVTQGYILPALWQLNLEHDISAETLRDLVIYSHLVPNDRRLLFLRGLAAGFDYDFMTAVHFLVPQLEYALRQKLTHLIHGMDANKGRLSVGHDSPTRLFHHDLRTSVVGAGGWWG